MQSIILIQSRRILICAEWLILQCLFGGTGETGYLPNSAGRQLTLGGTA
jgi:hypothetical protein